MNTGKSYLIDYMKKNRDKLPFKAVFADELPNKIHGTKPSGIIFDDSGTIRELNGNENKNAE